MIRNACGWRQRGDGWDGGKYERIEDAFGRMRPHAHALVIRRCIVAGENVLKCRAESNRKGERDKQKQGGEEKDGAKPCPRGTESCTIVPLGHGMPTWQA